ncbi:hypothetical protein JCM24511_03394 [Saitozyma sp. JCM 24511]|nr:hypothetical protein JCM24511_03394 [Saitozyma sp. JCM 24511]
MAEVDVGPSEADVFITSSTVSAIASTSALASGPASADASVMSSSASSTTSATASYHPRPVARLPTIPSSSRSQGSPPFPSNRLFRAPAYIPIPGSSTTPYPYNAIAGPSSEGALPRRGSEDA